MATKGTRKRVWTEAVQGAKKTQKVWKQEVKARGRFSSGSGPELKFFDTALSFAFDATGEVPATGQLALIPQGVTESTRVGRKCVIRSIQIRAEVTFVPAAAATASTICYVYLVQDTQTNGAAAAVTDVVTSTNLMSAMRNLANGDRFRVLKIFTFPMIASAGVTTAYNNVTMPWTYYGKCNIPLEFSGTTGAITELRTNNLFLLAGTDGSSDDTPVVGGVVRLRFSDGS